MCDCSCVHCIVSSRKEWKYREIQAISRRVNSITQYIHEAEKIMNTKEKTQEKYDNLGILMINSIRRNLKIAYQIHVETQQIVKNEILKSLEVFDDSE